MRAITSECERCAKPAHAEFYDRWPIYVVRSSEGDTRPVFCRLCNACVKLAVDGGALVEVDVLGYTSTRLWERLQTLVGCDRVPKETREYDRMRWRYERAGLV